MTLPREEPDDAIPIARLVRVLNLVGSIETVGVKSRPLPMSTQHAYASSACQYSVHRESIM